MAIATDGFGTIVGGLESGGGSASFKNGCSIGTLEAQDGSGTSTSDSTYLNLAGFCVFRSIRKADRADSKIYSGPNANSSHCALKVSLMIDKLTLDVDNTETTPDISGMLDGGLFLSEDSGWYAMTGELLVNP